MSTTVKAETSLSDWNYVYYCTDIFGEYHVFLSDYDVVLITNESGFISSGYDLTNGSRISLGSNAEYYVTSATAIYGSFEISNKKALHLKYNGLEWESYQPYFLIVSQETIGTQRGSQHGWMYCLDFPIERSANQRYIQSISNNKPSGFPEIDFSKITIEDVEAKIDDALNSTTTATTQANNIQTQVTNNYISYSNGEIDLATLQANIDSLAQQLDELNNRSGTTISDKIAINNAITQTQLVQDAANKDAIIQEMEEDLTVSSSISSTITGKINEANQVFNHYSQGSTTQSEALTQINQYITQLTQLITPQTPTADINAINAAINTINGIKDSVTSHSDLDKNISDEAQSSDEEELNYLDNLTSDTTSTIQDLSPEKEFSEQQKTAAKNLLSVIWEIDIIKILIPICACFMVVCVVLGIRYKV